MGRESRAATISGVLGQQMTARLTASVCLCRQNALRG